MDENSAVWMTGPYGGIYRWERKAGYERKRYKKKPQKSAGTAGAGRLALPVGVAVLGGISLGTGLPAATYDGFVPYPPYYHRPVIMEEDEEEERQRKSRRRRDRQ